MCFSLKKVKEAPEPKLSPSLKSNPVEIRNAKLSCTVRTDEGSCTANNSGVYGCAWIPETPLQGFEREVKHRLLWLEYKEVNIEEFKKFNEI